MPLLTQEAEVIAVFPGRLHLKACARQGCSSCQLSGACGQGLWSRWLAASTPRIELASNQPYQVGDRLLLGIEPEQVNRAAGLQFALPLLTLLLAALLAEYSGLTAEAPSWAAALIHLAFAGAGLGLGLVLARRLAPPSKPQILRTLTESFDAHSHEPL